MGKHIEHIISVPIQVKRLYPMQLQNFCSTPAIVEHISYDNQTIYSRLTYTFCNLLSNSLILTIWILESRSVN